MTETWLHRVQVIVDEAMQFKSGNKTADQITGTAYDLSKTFEGIKGEAESIVMQVRKSNEELCAII